VTIQVRLQAIPLTDVQTDAAGNPLHPFAIAPGAFSDLVGRVNWSYEGTDIVIVFDPGTDWQPMADTVMNRDQAGRRDRGNGIAAGFPGKVVCFLRWGGGDGRTGNGNAYPPPEAGPVPPSVDGIEQNYVALPDAIAPPYGLLNQGNGSFVAHELGHYLGLYHTFPGWGQVPGPIYAQSSPTAAEADLEVLQYAVSQGGTIAAFDGDGLADTAPDPSPTLYQAHGQNICTRRAITVSGTVAGQPLSLTFTPDPNNAMGYFATCPATDPPVPARFSPDQIALMQRTLHGARSHVARIRFDGIANERELWIALGDPPAGQPIQAYGILTGTAVFAFAGLGAGIFRDAVEFLVGPELPASALLLDATAVGGLASIANNGAAIDALWALDEVDVALDRIARRVRVRARLAVSDVDGFVQRISYKVNGPGAVRGQRGPGDVAEEAIDMSSPLERCAVSTAGPQRGAISDTRTRRKMP